MLVVGAVIALSATLQPTSALVLDIARSNVEAVTGLLSSSEPQAAIRRIVQAHRAEVLAAGAPSGAALRKQVGVALGQAAAQAAIAVTPEFLASSTKELNGLIAQAQWELDKKLAECRAQPDDFGEGADEAAEDVQEMSAEVSYARTEMLQATDEFPEDKEYLQDMRTEFNSDRRDCNEEHNEHLNRANLLQQDRATLALLQAVVNSHCGNGNGNLFLQRPPSSNASVVQASQGRIGGPVSPRAAALAALVEAATAGGGGGVAAGAGSGSRLRLRSSTSRSSDFCAKLTDALGGFEGEIEDEEARLAWDREEATHECQEQARFEQQQMAVTARRKADLQNTMSKATATIAGLSERTHHRDEERRQSREDARFAKIKCQREVDEILHQKLCGFIRLRDQIWLSAGETNMPQDCEVTEWLDGQCSKTCGGGIQASTREVILPASSSGAACPPLKMESQCSTEQCPQHCVISMWSGWSACSAPCDGGIQERTRGVITKERHGGDPCPELVEMRTCSMHACTADCELSDWSQWGLCTQACNGGSSYRYKSVVRPPVGSGRCFDQDDPQRRDRMACNQQACPDAKKIVCSGAPMDIALLVDSSGSVGSEASFGLLKGLVKELGTRLSPGTGAGATQVGVVSFSKTANLVSQFTGDSAALSAKVDSDLTWMQRESMLSRGLSRVWALFQPAMRTAAVPTVVVLTDGHLADPFQSERAAKKLKDAGIRVMLAVFGAAHREPEVFRKLVSQPPEENIISETSGIAGLGSNTSGIAGAILQRACGGVSLP